MGTHLVIPSGSGWTPFAEFSPKLAMTVSTGMPCSATTVLARSRMWSISSKNGSVLVLGRGGGWWICFEREFRDHVALVEAEAEYSWLVPEPGTASVREWGGVGSFRPNLGNHRTPGSRKRDPLVGYGPGTGDDRPASLTGRGRVVCQCTSR